MSARRAATRAEANAFIGVAQSSGEDMRSDATERNRGSAPGARDSRRRSREDGFRRGDEACSHRERCPDGDSDCASRFRLDPTHSLLLGVRLGRNLITLFSTVNTPREKKSAAMRAAGERDRIEARREDATRARRIRASKPRRKKKIAFFKTFRSREKRNGAARGDEGDVRERRARRRDRRVNRSDTKTPRAVRIRRRRCPIARICANFQRRFGARRRVVDASRTARDACEGGIDDGTDAHDARVARARRERWTFDFRSAFERASIDDRGAAAQTQRSRRHHRRSVIRSIAKRPALCSPLVCGAKKPRLSPGAVCDRGGATGAQEAQCSSSSSNSA